MRYKKAVRIFLVLLVVFAGLNYAIWRAWTEDILTDDTYDGGDLARLGYCYGAKCFRKNSDDLPRRHQEIRDYAGGRVDMVTIGDSFSHGGAGGKNRFYQDYIASINGLSVLNLDRYRDLDLITTASILCNNGFLDRVKPRYVMVSMAEKGCGDLAVPIDFSRTIGEEELRRLPIVEYYADRPQLNFLNDGNLKFVLSNLLRRFSDHNFNAVYFRKLREPLFTVRDSDELLFLKQAKRLGSAQIGQLNDNLNALADRLRPKGMTLVFMPCVEKYTLYGDYLVAGPQPRITFFEDLRPLPKRYIFIDTQAILLDAVRNGEKDIFYADDTHWSWKASRTIFEAVRFAR